MNLQLANVIPDIPRMRMKTKKCRLLMAYNKSPTFPSYPSIALIGVVSHFIRSETMVMQGHGMDSSAMPRGSSFMLFSFRF